MLFDATTTFTFLRFLCCAAAGNRMFEKSFFRDNAHSIFAFRLSLHLFDSSLTLYHDGK